MEEKEAKVKLMALLDFCFLNFAADLSFLSLAATESLLPPTMVAPYNKLLTMTLSPVKLTKQSQLRAQELSKDFKNISTPATAHPIDDKTRL